METIWLTKGGEYIKLKIGGAQYDDRRDEGIKKEMRIFQ